jgi:hypothetical protein
MIIIIIIMQTTTLVETDNIIKNKGFILLDNLFTSKNWYKSKNEQNEISWRKQYAEIDEFKVKIDKTKIHVSIPLKNSAYRYTTVFDNYFLANEYLETRFKEFDI